mgnify:FL=1|tara:strand:+ start:280 stop:657 length:378 start_codon:yes stop_codon:yes gene_type:complete
MKACKEISYKKPAGIGFKPGQIIKHKSTDSLWIVVEINAPKETTFSHGYKSMTMQVDAVCLYTGKRNYRDSYWSVGQLDSWIVDIDKEGNANYFIEMWEIIMTYESCGVYTLLDNGKDQQEEMVI